MWLIPKWNTMEHWEIMTTDVSPPAYSNSKADTNTDPTHYNPYQYHRAFNEKSNRIQLGYAPNHGQNQYLK